MTTSDPYVEDLYAEEVVPQDETTSRFKLSPFMVVIAVAVVLLLAVAGWGIYQNSLDTRTSGEAPDFTITTYEGDEFKLSDYRGEAVVVINVWQSNCPPCHEEAPMLVRVSEEYRDKGVMFVGINAKDPDYVAVDYIAQYGITYPNGLDVGDRIQDEYRTTGYPETFIIDRNGMIQRHFAGPPSEATLRAEIDRVLDMG
ncbi:MAG: TlpA family protein disulfide reductase [Chloroflexi bacterium]|nr:TlpA family protein disulfide reductase [Chloroflexota bacterium]